jgi:hypothetical protein
LAVPALGTGLLAFNAGGFLPGTTSTACILSASVSVSVSVCPRPRPRPPPDARRPRRERWRPALGIAAGALAILVAEHRPGFKRLDASPAKYDDGSWLKES